MAFLLGFICSGKLTFGEAYYWKEFFVSKWFGLDNKNSVNTTKTASTNSSWVYLQEGFLSEGFLRLRFGGLIFGRTNPVRRCHRGVRLERVDCIDYYCTESPTTNHKPVNSLSANLGKIHFPRV